MLLAIFRVGDLLLLALLSVSSAAVFYEMDKYLNKYTFVRTHIRAVSETAWLRDMAMGRCADDADSSIMSAFSAMLSSCCQSATTLLSATGHRPSPTLARCPTVRCRRHCIQDHGVPTKSFGQVRGILCM